METTYGSLTIFLLLIFISIIYIYWLTSCSCETLSEIASITNPQCLNKITLLYLGELIFGKCYHTAKWYTPFLIEVFGNSMLLLIYFLFISVLDWVLGLFFGRIVINPINRTIGYYN